MQPNIWVTRLARLFDQWFAVKYGRSYNMLKPDDNSQWQSFLVGQRLYEYLGHDVRA